MSDDKADDRQQMWAGEFDASDTKDTSDDTDTSDAMDAQGSWDVASIRDSWHPNSVRLPDSLQRRWNAYHARIESEFALEGVDRKFGKDRYYKPLVIALGLRALDAMDTNEVVDALDDLERKGNLDD